METGKFNCLIDQAWGSSGKGKISAWLADKFGIVNVSSSNYPNAGHTAAFQDGTKFVAKALPTAAILKKVKGVDIKCFVSPGSGFFWKQLIKEWDQANRPKIFIHDRTSIVTDEHKKREESGANSTKHVASTMQGTAAAITDRIMRKPDVILARSSSDGGDPVLDAVRHLINTDEETSMWLDGMPNEFCEQVKVVDAFEFRNLTHNIINEGHTWLHEGSQGYALSIDHGSHYPYCTSRNCTLQAAMDHMAIPPSMIGDVYMNLRTVPIRVGNVIEEGKQKGYSGDFYPDCKELTWEQVADQAGMPEEEKKILAERERTTVTKRIRRVATFSWIGLQDAVRTNGVTKISVNFVQYLNWQDHGIRGGKEALEKLSSETRQFIDKVEEIAQVPVVLIGTGADHEDIISLL